MTVLMADRIRLIVDTDDTVRRAVHLRRIKTGGDTTVSDVVNQILREALAVEIREVESYPPPPPRSGEGPAKGRRKA
jgi:hypothetical protein